MAALKDKGVNTNEIVVNPKYEFDPRLKVDREVNPPPPSLYLEVGYNENKDSGKKHYRRYYPDELEQISEVIPRKPFHEERVYRAA